MLKKLLNAKNRWLAPSPESLQPKKRMRAVSGSDAASRAAHLLIAPTALMQLKPAEALTIVSYMTPRKIAMGTTFIREGDTHDTGYMVLLLEGEVTVENIEVSRTEPVTITVLGPGSLVGEMGLIDGQARQASCTASTDVVCAILSRAALEKLSADNPKTAAKLMMAVSLRIAQRLRDTSEKVKRYSQLVLAMQQEIDHMMPT
jgi:CRP/FNR family cyclic AMP-dependent transcriptional regulator